MVLVDDDSDYLELCMLVAAQCSAIAHMRGYADVRQAVAAAGEWKRDARLIVLDYHLAGRTALDVLADLRAQGCNQPFAVLSGGASPAEKALCLQAGALAVLRKPSSLARIAGVLTTLARLAHLSCGTPGLRPR